MNDVKQGVTLTEPDLQDNDNVRVQERDRLIQGKSHLGAHKGLSALSIHNSNKPGRKIK